MITKIMIWIVVLALQYVLLVASFLPAYAGYISIFLWLASLALGLLCVGAVWLALRFIRRAHPQPASA